MDFQNMQILDMRKLLAAYDDARKLYHSGNFAQALVAIKPVLPIANSFVSIKPFVETGLKYSDYAQIYGLVADIYGELGAASEAAEYYNVHQYLKMQLNPSFPKGSTLRLFQFRGTTSKHSFENLRNRQVSLTKPQIQNDIVDCPVFLWLETLCGVNANHKGHIPYFKKSFDGYRCTSFCIDSDNHKAVENTLMWAHYAESHKGFCVEYEVGELDMWNNYIEELTASRLFKIIYNDPDNQSDVMDFSNPNTLLTSAKGFITKSKDWAYENEVRLVSFNPNFEGKDHISYHFKTPNAFKAIYFGYKCSDETKQRIINILGDSVEYFQMDINIKNIHRLIFRPLQLNGRCGTAAALS